MNWTLVLFCVWSIGICKAVVNLQQNITSELKNKNNNNFFKCCPTGYVLHNDIDRGLLSCVKFNKNSSPLSSVETTAGIKPYNYGLTNNRIEIFNLNRSVIIQGNNLGNVLPICAEGRKPRVLHNRNGVWYRFSENNTDIQIGLDYFLWAAWLAVNKSSYCLDMDETAVSSCRQISSSSNIVFSSSRDNNKLSLTCANDPLLLVFCDLNSEQLFEFSIHRYIFGLSSLATCVPILITLFLFFLLGIHENPRKWILISYFLSYTLACGVHGSQILIYINNLDQEPTLSCKLFNHFFVYLSCVFGTACMFVSLDIFWCFLKMNSHLGIINPSKGGIIFSLILTWFGPLVIYVAGEIWREYYAFRPPDLAWKKCMSLNFDTVTLMIMIQFVFKFGIYLSTSLLIYKHKRSTSFATSRAQKDFNESTTLYAKLFVTTGMPFTCLALDYCFADVDPMAWYWFLLRFPHSFIGLYIFLVFGLSREVRKRWIEKFRSSDHRELKCSQMSNDSEISSDISKRSRRYYWWESKGDVRKFSNATLWSSVNSKRFSQNGTFSVVSKKDQDFS